MTSGAGATVSVSDKDMRSARRFRSIGAGIVTCGAIALGIYEIGAIIARWLAFGPVPDLNGDGAYTVLDIPQMVITSVVGIGEDVQRWFASAPYAAFLEMSATEPRLLWSIAFAVAAYIAPFYLLMKAEDYGAITDDELRKDLAALNAARKGEGGFGDKFGGWILLAGPAIGLVVGLCGLVSKLGV